MPYRDLVFAFEDGLHKCAHDARASLLILFNVRWGSEKWEIEPFLVLTVTSTVTSNPETIDVTRVRAHERVRLVLLYAYPFLWHLFSFSFPPSLLHHLFVIVVTL